MRFYTPILLFLDRDLPTSARYLTNWHLEHGIRNACQVLMCSMYYMLGFRNKTVFRHWFSKERWDETRFRYFPNYPLKRIPKYTFYTSYEARWCRMSSTHYNYLVRYFGCMLEEHAFRYCHEHELVEMHQFLHPLPMEVAVRLGIRPPRGLSDKGKMQLPWKNLHPRFRRKDVIAGYRLYYKSIIPSPLAAFIGTKRDVPEFLVDNEYAV